MIILIVLNDTCDYQWRENDDWSVCPSGCGNYTSKRTVDCITDSSFGTNGEGKPVNLPDNYGCFATSGNPITTKKCPNTPCPRPDNGGSSDGKIFGIPSIIIYISGPLIAIVIAICCYMTIKKVRRARARAAADAAYAAFDYPLMMSETNINADTEDE
jgi:hypothetical protein